MDAAEATRVVPDIGDIVEYGLNGFETGPATYRVTAWLKPRPVDPKPTGHDMLVAGAMWRDLDLDQLSEALLHDLIPGEDPRGTQLVWCLREEATHVALSGICGAVAPVESCEVTGRVDWSPRMLAMQLESAEALGRSGRPSDVFVKNI